MVSSSTQPAEHSAESSTESSDIDEPRDDNCSDSDDGDGYYVSDPRPRRGAAAPGDKFILFYDFDANVTFMVKDVFR